MFIYRLLIVLVCFTLTACSSEPISFNLFGKDNSCYQLASPKSCVKLKAYDSVKMNLNFDKQSISFVQAAYRLDNSNTIFNTLENCKIIDKENFSCDGLKRVDGKFQDYSIFKNRFLSESVALSILASLDITVQQSTFIFLDEHSKAVNLGVGVFIILAAIGFFS